MSMRSMFAVGAAALVLVAGTTSAEEKAPVRLAGLQLTGAGAGTNGSELQAFQSQSGTTLALIAHAPGDRRFVEVDDDRCELTSFADDSGRNLLDGVDWGSFPSISEDGRFALVEVRSKIRPAPGATRVVARGSIRGRIAKGTATAKIDPLELREGFEFEVHGQPVRVVKVGTEDGLTLIMQTSRSFEDDLQEVRFFGADGQPIEVWGRGAMTFGDATQLEFNLSGTSTSLSAEFELWQGLETVDLPFALEVGVGLEE